MRKTRLAVSLALLMALGVTAAALAQTAPAGKDAPAAIETIDPAPAPGVPVSTPSGAAGTGTPGTLPPKKQESFLEKYFLFIMVGGFLLLWVWMGRGRKKEKRKRKEMLEALKKGDKVTSIGGIIGTVVDVRDDEVTVKIDEAGNTRMKFARWAIRDIGDAGKAEKKD